MGLVNFLGSQRVENLHKVIAAREYNNTQNIDNNMGQCVQSLSSRITTLIDGCAVILQPEPRQGYGEDGVYQHKGGKEERSYQTSFSAKPLRFSSSIAGVGVHIFSPAQIPCSVSTDGGD
jgi:hypothetical protein